MSPRFILIVACVALSFMAAVVAVYLDMYGVKVVYTTKQRGAHSVITSAES